VPPLILYVLAYSRPTSNQKPIFALDLLGFEICLGVVDLISEFSYG